LAAQQGLEFSLQRTNWPLQMQRLVTAEDNYTQLNNDNWGSDAHFIHWVEHSDDPVACYINARTIPEEDPATVANFGTNDTAYWLQYIPKHYHQHGVVFSKTALERMPMRKLYNHAIELNPGATLLKPAKLYPLNKHKCLSLDKWIAAKMKKGYIRPSKSPTAAPVLFVKKKDGTLCLVQDY
jgi:hypothetical protein